MSLRIEKQTLENVANSLAAYYPNGKLWESKYIEGTNIRALIKGISGILFDAENFLEIYSSQFIPTNTVFFVEDWEQALSIPDQCFLGTGTIEQRRRDILVKLASLGVQTEADFIRLAAIFGIDVTITTGPEVGSFPMSFPLVFFATPADAVYTIIINFPLPTGNFFIYNFPIIFGDETQSILRCIFEQLIPDNCRVIFRSS